MSNKYPTRFADRRKELGEIHRRAELLGMDTKDASESSEYRSMLWTVARVRSSAALDHAGRRKVLDHLAELMKARGLPLAYHSPNAGKPTVKSELQPLANKVGALLADMKLPWKYATAILKRQASVERLEWADAAQLHDVVTALVKRQGSLSPRERAEGEGERP